MIEVLVAFVMLSLALGVLLGGLTIGLRNTHRSAQAGLAVLHAESLMAETGISIPLADGETSGRTETGFVWKRQISRLPEVTPPTVFPSFTVSISVTPPDNGAPVRLVTLRLSDIPAMDRKRP
ncbi:MAG: hypothetical protein ABL951_00510 [Alphaproteobacteria bacterium]